MKFLVILFILLIGVASAGDHYIDFDDGSDVAAGTSEETAWKHCPGDSNATGNAASHTFAADDIIYFKKGVIYIGNITVGQSGSFLASGLNAAVASDGITVTASGADFVTDGVTSSDKIYLNGNDLYDIASVDSATQLTLDAQTRIYPVSRTEYSIGRFIKYTTKSDWGIGNATIQGKFVISGRSYIWIDNLRYEGGTQYAIYANGGALSSPILTNLTIYNTGNGPVYGSAAIYLAGPVTYGSIDNCSIDSIGKHIEILGFDDDDGIQITGASKYITMNDLYINYTSDDGIQMAGCDECYVDNSEITNIYCPVVHADGIATNGGGSHGIYRWNYIHDVAGMNADTHHDLYGNIITDTKPDDGVYLSGFITSGYGNFSDNIFAFVGLNSMWISDAFADPAQPSNFTGNIIWNDHESGGEGTPSVHFDEGFDNTTLDYNIYVRTNNPPSDDKIASVGGTSYSLAELQALDHETHGQYFDNAATLPRFFINTTQENLNKAGFTPYASVSPQVDNGTAIANMPQRDIIGTTIPQGSAPDIGAYEFDSDEEPDETDPVITAFSIDPTSSDLTIGVISFTATNATHYQITESATPPTSGWLDEAPTSYVAASEGAKTLYGWVQNESSGHTDYETDTCTITLPSADVYVLNDGLTRVRPDDVPGVVTSASISAARNEYEPFQVVVHAADGNLTNVNLSMSDLIGTGGTIDSGNVTLYREHYINITTISGKNIDGEQGNYNVSNYYDRGLGLYPDGLIPFVVPFNGTKLTASSGVYTAITNISNDTNQPYWIDVYVPTGTTPGTYTGSLTISADNVDSVNVPVNLTIREFTLPMMPTMKTYFGSPGSRLAVQYGLTENTTECNNILYNYSQFLADCLICPIVPNSFKPYYTASTGELYKIRTDLLNNWMTRYHCNAIDILYPTLSGGNASYYNYYQDLYAYYDNLGYGDYVYLYTTDEPSTFDAYNTTRLKSAVLHDAGTPIKSLVTTNPNRNPSYGTLNGSVDIWVSVPRYYLKSAFDARIVVGDEGWSYACLVNTNSAQEKKPFWQIDFPLVNYRIMPWINYENDLTGLLYWSTNYWTINHDVWVNPVTYTLNSYLYNGEGSLFYPANMSYNGFVGACPSMRLFQIREGLEDYEYMKLAEAATSNDYVKTIVDDVATDFTVWNSSTDNLYDVRDALADTIITLPPGPGERPLLVGVRPSGAGRPSLPTATLMGIVDSPTGVIGLECVMFSRFNATTTGRVDTLTIHERIEAGQDFGKIALYSEGNATYPGTLLAANNTEVEVFDGDNSFVIPATNVVAGTRYWIGYASENGQVSLSDASAVNDDGWYGYKTKEFDGYTFPTTFSDTLTHTVPMDGYSLLSYGTGHISRPVRT